MTPLTHPAKNWPDGKREQGREVVLHVQEEVYQLTLIFRRRVARYLEWSPLPIQPRRLTRWTVRTSISAPDCRSEADLHVLPERILASGEAKLEWLESGGEEAREYNKKNSSVLRP